MRPNPGQDIDLRQDWVARQGSRRHIGLNRDKFELNMVVWCREFELSFSIVNSKEYWSLYIHENHLGITRMKAVAQSYVWWSGLHKNIEDQVKKCLPCQEQKSKPACAPLHPWIWPTASWKKVHIDFAGLFLDKMFLIVVNAHSKWPEVIQMSSTTAPKTIQAHQSLFVFTWATGVWKLCTVYESQWYRAHTQYLLSSVFKWSGWNICPNV